MSKVVGLDSTKKPDPCQFCGSDPPHHSALACPRVKYAEIDDEGGLIAVEFFEPAIWNPPVGDETV